MQVVGFTPFTSVATVGGGVFVQILQERLYLMLDANCFPTLDACRVVKGFGALRILLSARSAVGEPTIDLYWSLCGQRAPLTLQVGVVATTKRRTPDTCGSGWRCSLRGAVMRVLMRQLIASRCGLLLAAHRPIF